MLVLFNFSLIGPIFFADANPDLPSCCRRTGMHHCSMGAPPVHGATLTKAMKCPLFPAASVTPLHNFAKLAVRAESVATLLAGLPAGIVQAEARYRVSFNRSRQKRGPPSPLFS
jgi:hypothetical protein